MYVNEWIKDKNTFEKSLVGKTFEPKEEKIIITANKWNEYSHLYSNINAKLPVR